MRFNVDLIAKTILGNLGRTSTKTVSSITPDSFPNIRLVLGIEKFDQEFVDNINETLLTREGANYAEKLDRIETGFASVEEGDLVDQRFIQMFAKTGRRDLISKLAKTADENVKHRELRTRITEYGRNLKNIGNLKRGFRSFFDDDLRSIEADVFETSRILENNIVSPLRDKYGGEAKTFLRIVSRDPDRLLNLYNTTQDEVVADLLSGQSGSKIPIVKDFVNLYSSSFKNFFRGLERKRDSCEHKQP